MSKVGWHSVKLAASKQSSLRIIIYYFGLVIAFSIFDTHYFLSKIYDKNKVYNRKTFSFLYIFIRFIFFKNRFVSRYVFTHLAHRESSVINDSMGFIFVITAVGATFYLAESLTNLSFNSYQFTLCLVSLVNGGNNCRLLDKQILETPYYLPVAKEGLFQLIFSISATLLISLVFSILNFFSFVLPFLSFLKPQIDLANSYNKFKHSLFGFIIPNSSKSISQSSYITQFLCLIISIYSVLVLSLIFTELLNRYSHNLDGIISHQLQSLPQNSEINFQDECIIARALGNYGRGVSYMIGIDKADHKPRAVTAGILHQTSVQTAIPNRSPPEPMGIYYKIMKNHYDEGIQRRNTDPVVYKMFLDPNSILWKTYTESGLRVIRECSYQLSVLSNYINQFADYSQDMKIHIRLFVEPNSISSVKQISPDDDKINFAMDLITLSVLYIRGITCWLCIANLLDQDSFSIKYVARDIIGESISLLQSIECFPNSNISNAVFYNLLSTLETEISLCFKQLSVYTETVLFFRQNSPSEIVRVVEHLYRN